MIFTWFFELFFTMVGALIGEFFGLLPAPPAWVETGLGYVAVVYRGVDSMGAWIPVSYAITVGAAIIAAWWVGTLIQLVRMILSYLTLGGGAKD